MTYKIKNIYSKGLLVIGLLAVFTSCSNELDLDPKANWKAADFYSNETEVNVALAGIYSSLRSNYGETLVAMDYGTDEGYAFESWVERVPTNLYAHNDASPEITSVWRNFYAGINNINQFIRNIDAASFEEEEDYNKAIGEARFLRGFFYYQLTVWWNEVPLRLEPVLDQSSNHVAPSSVTDVYLQIIEDLTFASENLPTSFEDSYVPGHANKMAAHAMLAKTYLKAGGYPLKATEINGMNPFEAARDQCQIIIDSPHKLNPNYRDLFLTYIQNNYDLEESLFEVVFKNAADIGIGLAGTIGTRNGLFYKPNERLGTPYAEPRVAPSAIVAATYDPADVRSSWNVPGISGRGNGTINVIADALSWGYSIGKFRRWDMAVPGDVDASNLSNTPIVALEGDSNSQTHNTGINFPLIRYADVLLMFAEASFEANGRVATAEAIAAIDEIRTRAGLLTSVTEAVDVGDPDEFFTEIVDERLRELCFEGHRKADLIRWGILPEKLIAVGLSINPDGSLFSTNGARNGYLRCVRNFDAAKHLSLPYPQQEVLINNKLDQKDLW